MDSGAQFHRCDFQVHSPRDLRWQGITPESDEDREAFAENFVEGCRARGLDAVAITDHHDLAFFPYIKRAAVNDLVVFPGMELTLGVPCQALLILDADFPETLLGQVPLALGINPADPAEPKHAQTQPIQDCREISQVIQLLDRHDFLQGRYILIPNVTENGHKTLLRSGFRDHYANMPCVAGYVDGAVPATTARGWWSITEGRDPNFGSRRIGVFQTSDCRSDTLDILGQPSTWVKWAEPTAEALRQACLARETRIAHEPPELPAVAIKRLQVSNSHFLGPIDIECNQQYNCLIGGRGTGKSTVLEYLRWALCDQPPDFAVEDDLPDYQVKRRALIENTLAPYQATVTVDFEINGVVHTVRRKSAPHELVLRIGEGVFRPCDEQEIRDLLAVQGYSQKQLSSVGIRADELLRLLVSPVKLELAELKRRESDVLKSLREVVGSRHQRRKSERDLRREQTERDSLATQLKSLREGLKGVSDTDQAILNAHSAIETERAAVSNIDDRVERMKRAVADLNRELALLTPPKAYGSETPESDGTVKEVEDAYAVLQDAVREGARQIELTVADSEEARALEAVRATWQSRSEDHQRVYNQAKERASAQQSTIDAIAQLESQVARLAEGIRAREAEMARMGDPESRYAQLIRDWSQVTGERASLLERECDRLTELSEGRIKASIARGHNTSEIERRLIALVSGTRIRQAKVERLGEHVAAADSPLEEWCAIADELAHLVDLEGSPVSATDLPETPLLNRLGFTAAELLKIAAQITVQDWMATAFAGIEDVPVFEYCQSEGDYIAFENASAGQQATALLQVLLNQPGAPLIIDQPEEDLDNEVVLEIVESVWRAKRRRQLIISSHNANLVVNGDADLVVVCAYRNAGDHSGGKIAVSGAIDNKPIRNAITSIMEGGERAFVLRKEKYGF